MNYAESILPEFDREMANTRKVLERVPEDTLDWQAHPKSHTVGWNANHLAEILGWVEGVLGAKTPNVAGPTGPDDTTSRTFRRTSRRRDNSFKRDKTAGSGATADSCSSRKHRNQRTSTNPPRTIVPDTQIPRLPPEP
jgi:hypothetical protein